MKTAAGGESFIRITDKSVDVYGAVKKALF